VFRPWGLFGRPQGHSRNSAPIEAPLRRSTVPFKVFIAAVVAVLVAIPLLSEWFPYAPMLMRVFIIAALFALRLSFMMGPGGMNSFGHAAYYGLGAYGAALLLKEAAFSMGWAIATAPLIAGVGALVFGWFCIRLSGVYLAMLTLAFAQIVWSIVFQWDDFPG